MQDFLSKAGRAAKEVAAKAGDKAGDVVEISKIKARIHSEKAEIKEMQQKIGAFCYEQFEAGEVVDSKVGDWCAEISEHKSRISDLEEKMQDVKDGDC